MSSVLTFTLVWGCLAFILSTRPFSTSDVLKMEKHLQHLNKCCRVCAIAFARIPKGGNGYECLGEDKKSKMPWRELLIECFSIDPNKDISGVHPHKFCCKCKHVIERFCKAHVDGKTYIHSVEIALWEAHSDSCKVCDRFSGKCKRLTHRPKKHKKNPRPKAGQHYQDVQLHIQTVEAPNDHCYTDKSAAAQFMEKRMCGNTNKLHADVENTCTSDTGTVIDSYTLENDISHTNLDISNTNLDISTDLQESGFESASDISASSQNESTCENFMSRPLAQSTPCRRGRPPLPLKSLSQNSLNQRLKPIKTLIKEHSERFNEDEEELYKTLILNHLKSKREFKKADRISEVFTDDGELDAATCLAIRINNFQSVTKYRRMQQAAKAGGKDVFKSYFAIREEEKNYLPGSNFNYSVVPPLTHSSSNGSSIDAMDYLPYNLPDLGMPFVKAERFYYDEAVAMAIKDLETCIVEGLVNNGKNPEAGIHHMSISIKDGADGMGEIKRKNFKSENLLADKALRYSFSVLEVKMGNVSIYKEEKPNSQYNCRPLLVALADENDFSAFTAMTQPLLKERSHLENAILEINHGLARWNFKIEFHATMYDEKLERKAAGLAGCASEYLCTLCESTRKQAYDDPFKFQICRNSNRHMELIDERTENDNQQSYKQLTHNSKGVVSDSFINNTPHIDSLHCEINNAIWFKKIFIREMAGVHQWAKKGVEEKLAAAEDRLDRILRKETGLQRRLMQPGNYSRQLLGDKCVNVVISLIPIDRQDVVLNLIQSYTKLKRVWKATWPMESCPAEVTAYHIEATIFMNLLKSEFSYCESNLPNYIHKMVSHVPELLEKFGSVGAFSSEANEHGNKLFRMLRKMGSRQNTKFELHDILKFHWLYTMKRLQIKAQSSKITQKCSLCFSEGHNKRTCPNSVM